MDRALFALLQLALKLSKVILYFQPIMELLWEYCGMSMYNHSLLGAKQFACVSSIWKVNLDQTVIVILTARTEPI